MNDRKTPQAMGASAWAFSVWGVAFTYAVVRYVVFGPVDTSQIPLFILNKSLASAAVALFSLSLILAKTSARGLARDFGVVGTWLVLAHVLASLALLASGYFEKLHTPSGELHLRGQIGILTGVLGACVLVWQKIYTTHPRVGAARRLVVGLGILHVTALGFPGWFKPETWHGSLPPITLLAAGVGGCGLVAGLLRVRR